MKRLCFYRFFFWFENREPAAVGFGVEQVWHFGGRGKIGSWF